MDNFKSTGREKTGCLKNSALQNLDPRPEKLRPSGVSKTQTRKSQILGCLENSDPKNKTYLHRVNAARQLVYCSLIQWHYQILPRKEKQLIMLERAMWMIMKIICREKKKELAVLDTCNDHENYT